MKRTFCIKAETLILIALVSACSSSEQPQATAPSAAPSALSEKFRPAPVPVQVSPLAPQTDPFEQASDMAMSAANITQSAQSQDDWKLVVAHWQQAIALMKAVPTSSPKRTLAQKKVVEYQRNFAYARQNVIALKDRDSFPTIAPSLPAVSPTLPSSAPTSSIPLVVEAAPPLLVPPPPTPLRVPPPPRPRPPGVPIPINTPNPTPVVPF